MQISRGEKKQQRPESGFEPETSCIFDIPKAGIIPLDHPGDSEEALLVNM